MKTVVLLGSNGQLGQTLLHSEFVTQCQVVPYTRAQLDISNADAIASMLEQNQPDVIVNAAAFTAVDAAESQQQQAFAINATALEMLARQIAGTDVYLIHLSTDFVFSGSANTPYRPEAESQPVSVYGASKLAGERVVQRYLPQRSAIIRTAWLYSEYGNNFVKTMLRLMQERPVLNVVVDQVGTPCSTHTLSHCIGLATEQQPAGIFHWSDAGVASWYDFAVAIQEEAFALGLIDRVIPIVPISAKEFPTTARRPAYSVLDKSKTVSELGCPQIHWRVALRSVMQALRAAS